MLWKPDQTFYPSPRMAMQGPRERLGYVATFSLDPKHGKRDAINVLDLDPGSPTFAKVVGRLEMPDAGNELHHFGWNACSARCAPTRLIRTSSAVTCWCRACAPRGSTSSTPSRIRARRKSSR